MAQHIFTGTAAPTTAPGAVGHHYVDTVAGTHYVSVGTATSADWIDITTGGGGGGGNSFVTINTPAGTDPVADSTTDTLNLTSSDSSVTITGTSGTDTVDFVVAGKQPLDATLTALAAHNTAGLLTQTAADTFTGRTITEVTGETVVTNGDGVAGNPTIGIGASVTTLTGTQNLTNKTLDNTNTVTLHDNKFTLQDQTDATKQAVFELSGVTTATTRTLTIPDASITVVGAANTQTLTNKTIDADANTITNIENADIKAGAAIAVNKLAALTVSRALVSDGSGFASASTTTAAEILHVNGVTSAIQTQLNAKQALDATLTALAAYSTNGIVTQTASDTFAGRTITGTANKVTVTNGDGVAGNPTLNIGTDVVTLTDTQVLTNKTIGNTNTVTLKDTLFTIQDDADATKLIAFQASGITTGTTRTLTVPDASLTIVGTATTQSLTNKTLDNTNTITVHDNKFTIQDQTDATKQVVFEASGVTTGTTRTLTVPDANLTITGIATTQTLTNKTIDADSNTITNIENADIKAAAAIAVNKLAALTASRAVVSDGSGFVSAATTTSTEIGYVNGVTSAIQTQLDARQLNTFYDIQTFTASGTWTKPTSLPSNAAVAVFVIGSGGGGGFGGSYAPGATGGSGGGGGGGGGGTWLVYKASDLSATETVTVAAGGAGGQSGVTPTGGTLAGQGARGGITSFGTKNYGGGGAGGGPGSLGATSGGGGAGGYGNQNASFGTTTGGAGGLGGVWQAGGTGSATVGSDSNPGAGCGGGGSSALGVAAAGGNSRYGQSGGGGGGGFNASAVAAAGASSGWAIIEFLFATAAGGAAGVAGTAGSGNTAAHIGPSLRCYATGGGGGGAGVTGAVGGAGGAYGGGGGGGGAGSTTGGNGGAGGGGLCIVCVL